MTNFNDQIKRMKDLMGCAPLNENNISSYNIEYHTIGADGKIYGIIKENSKYYIKVATENENIAESYDYIGGFCNKKDYEYNSYANAVKHLEMKLMSLNEACDKHLSTEILDPYKKEDLVIEGTEKMKAEIARQRQLMFKTLMNENNSIDTNNTGLPEAPKTTSFTPTIGEPYTDKAKAELDKDMKDCTCDPECQGEPFNDKCGKCDMESDKAPKCSNKNDYEDAKYVPNNSVANKKVKGNKPVKMNEDCDEWGSCGLPDEPGVGKNIPDVMGEEQSDDIVGIEDNMDDNELYDNNSVDYNNIDDITDDESYDDVMSDDESYDDVMSDDEFDELLNNTLDNNDSEEELPGSTFESIKNKKIDSIVESITRRIINEARKESAGILPEKWFKTDKDFMQIYKAYSKLIDILHEIKACKNADDVNSVYEKGENLFIKIKRVINGIVKGEKLNIKDDEYQRLKQSLNSGNDKDIKTLLLSLDNVWEQISSVWDDQYAKDAENNFSEKNKNWNKHKTNDLNYSTFDRNNIDDLERRDNEYANESKRPKKVVKEDTTVLHDFGKHPGYRKKPMTLPTNNADEKDGYKDWNDDSVKSDEPFGKKIGNSSPFDEKVKIITDAVINQIKEMAKKKR